MLGSKEKDPSTFWEALRAASAGYLEEMVLNWSWTLFPLQKLQLDRVVESIYFLGVHQCKKGLQVITLLQDGQQNKSTWKGSCKSA